MPSLLSLVTDNCASGSWKRAKGGGMVLKPPHPHLCHPPYNCHLGHHCAPAGVGVGAEKGGWMGGCGEVDWWGAHRWGRRQHTIHNGCTMHPRAITVITAAALLHRDASLLAAPPGRGPAGLAGRRRSQHRLCSTNAAQPGLTQARKGGLGSSNLPPHARSSARVCSGAWPCS